MSQNLDNTRRAYAAFAAGDIETVKSLMHDDVTFVIPGRNPFAGTYSGMDQVVGFFLKIFETTGGTLSQEMICNAEADNGDILVCVRERAQREGRSLDAVQIHRCTVVDGKLKRLQSFSDDNYAADAFWSDAITLPGQAAAPQAAAKV